MGINNLLKFMKPYVESVHIKKYAGKRVGIDAYSWLHKGAYSCSMEVSLDMEGDKKYQFLQYFMHRISMLRHYKITPVVVFDGGSIPCKAATEDERHRRRKTNRNMAMEKLKEGDTNAASELFQRAVSITPQMAHQLIQILRSENIEFVVAPYEADAQLAYLSSLETEKGGIVAIISEDSDLLAYGCPAVVFKMDRYGNGEEIILEKALNVAGCKPSFMNFDRELFTGMCILAGCDFLPSVPGIGIVKAYNLVAKYRNLDRVLSVLKFEKGKVVPEDYPIAFKQALAVFQHARVYDAASKKLKPLNPLAPELLHGDLDFLGPDLSPSIAVAIAEGNLDPCTMEAFNHFPQPGYKHNLSFPDSASQLSTQEEATGSMQEGCFTVVSCHKTVKKRIRGNMPLDAMKSSSEGKQMPMVREEVLHKSETLALKKLGFPSRNELSVQKEQSLLRFTPNIPCNNPFKKRKNDNEVQLNQAMASATEEQASEEAMASATEVEKSEIFRATQESDESIDSKLIKPKGKKLGEKLSKQSDCNHVTSKRCSILNFFSRV
ncbi:exonuclease 1-like [Salvia miltiorrhiza]|uniref:exonuclease 1-like n=1 Tax=Salvia miltiorrhiza TaxID=226208 RepID=UPI0025AD604B|nr:exonuclease 1-like [Salvia miltiorrhiza]XP_057810038.1 exonuclease 1-like [Salvia miltiorrhiza]